MPPCCKRSAAAEIASTESKRNILAIVYGRGLPLCPLYRSGLTVVWYVKIHARFFSKSLYCARRLVSLLRCFAKSFSDSHLVKMSAVIALAGT